VTAVASARPADHRSVSKSPARLPAKDAMRAPDVQDEGAPGTPVHRTVLADQLAWCAAIRPRLPSFPERQCGRTALHIGEGRSVHGVPLWTADVKPLRGDPALRVLVLGGIHGDEPASVTLVLDWLERAGRARDNKVHWRMVPLLNPDGLMARPSTRVNARGVDLNRNFPTPDWEALSTKYWVNRTRRDPRRYPGPKAMSEPETAWLYAQIGAFRPDLIVSVHAPYGVLDFDGPPPAPSRLGSLLLDRVGIYPGSLGNYGGVVRGVPVVTLELKRADAVPPAEVQALWEDLLGWMDRRLINVAQEASRRESGKAP